MNNNTLYTFFVCLSILTLCAIGACRRDDYYEGTDLELTTSVDTLAFDTVFTSIGSMTRILKIYNPEDQPILMDIRFENASQRTFRFNIDGFKGPDVKGVEIGPLDSVYVFVEATIDPDRPTEISPYVIEEKLTITANGNTKNVLLSAFGQNANYVPSSKKGGGFPYISCNFGQVKWDDPKPYVIYGILVIDSCSLVLPAGSRLYVHGGIVRNEQNLYNDGLIFVNKHGKIISEGTVDKPVTIQGDRLEPEFREDNSQWVGIRFFNESQGNVLVHTHIKNSIIGVRVDSAATLRLRNCIISNTGSNAVIGRHATINAENCLFYENQASPVALTFGGNYSFNYCTMASFTTNEESLVLTDFACYDQFCQVFKTNKLNATFRNCVITGADSDEIALGRRGMEADFKYNFIHCAFNIDELLLPKNHPNFLESTSECISLKRKDELFIDVAKNNFKVDTMSLLRGKAIAFPGVKKDIVDRDRKDIPDIGCYEFEE
jgi:hypothetical protein